MPKPSKLRHAIPPSIGEAQALLALHQIDPAEVTEVLHHSDGSLSILSERDGDAWHTGIEFDPELSAAIVRALSALDVPVERSSF